MVEAFKILLVDDDPTTHLLLQRVLRNEEAFSLDFVADPRHAMAHAESQAPDVVLLDMVMPIVDGLELLARFRANSAFVRLPLIMLSNQEDPGLKARAFANGADDFLIKLPDRMELLARLRRHAEANRARVLHERAEAERQIREERYRNLFLFSLDAIVIIDGLGGEIVEANPAAGRLFDLSVEGLVGDSLSRFQPEDGAPRLGTLFQEVAASGPRLLEDQTIRKSDGEMLTVHISASPFRQGERPLVQGIIRDVSRRKRMEAELRLHRDHLEKLVRDRTRDLRRANQTLESQQGELRKYESIVSASRDHMVLMDRQTRLLAVNETFLSALGKGRRLVVGAPLVEVLGDEALGLLEPVIFQTLRGESARLQAWMRYPGLGRVWMDHSLEPFCGDDGVVDGVVVVSRDLTARKKAEDALRESEQRFSLFMGHLPGIAFLKDGKGRYLFANPRFAAILDFPLEQILGRTDAELLAPDVVLQTRAHDLLSRMTGREYPFTETISTGPDWGYWIVHRFPIPDQEGALKYLGGVGVDVTDRVVAERALMTSEAKYLDLYDDSPDMLATADVASGLIVDGNQTLAAALGIKKADLIGKPFESLFPEPCGERARQVFDAFLETGWIRNEELPLLNADGGAVHSILGMTALRDATGRIVQGRLSLRDITERKEAEQEIRRRRAEVEALNATLERRVLEALEANRKKDHILMHQSRLAALGEMMGAIAHQWRQPITAINLILANLQDLFDEGELTSAVMADQVARTKRITQGMSATIDDFRTFFKPDRRSEAFLLADVTRQAISLVADSLAASRIEIDFDATGADSLWVMGFPNECAQVILSMLGNARDAILERDGGGGRIQAVLNRREERAVLAIQDNGVGMDPKILQSVFDPYFTTKQDKQGTGIGLYMAKMIIEDHMNGIIQGRNLAQGAEFQISLPLVVP